MRSFSLGPMEQEVMDCIWKEERLSVSDVHKCLRSKRKIAYTTVMTILTRLYKKGFLKRAKSGRQFLYQQATQEGVARFGTNLLTQVRRALFKKEMLRPVLALLDDESDISEDELMELKRVFDQKIKKIKKNKS